MKNSLIYLKPLALLSLLTLVSLILNGCALFQSKTNDAEIFQKINQLRNDYASQGDSYYGIGTGDTPEQAVANARIDLANQILTLVQKKTSSKLLLNQSQNKEQVASNFNSQQSVQSATFSAVELENTQTEKQGQFGKQTYYAVVHADKDTVRKIKAKAKRTASTLVIVNELQNIHDLSSRIHLIEKGYTEIQKHQIADETLLLNGAKYTFKSYFDTLLQQITQQIKTAVTKDGKVYAVYLLDGKTLTPINNIEVKINQTVGTTDEIGRMVVVKLPTTTRIYLMINQKPILLKTFIKGSTHSTIYVSTQPGGFVAELKENGHTIATITTPEEIPVELDSNKTYNLVLHGKAQYPGFTRSLHLTPGFDSYIFKQFEKLTYGSAQLELDDSDDELVVTSPKGQTLYQGSEDYVNPKLAVGTYQVKVQQADHDPEYQIIKDHFLLAQNQKIHRKYFSPKYRQFYREGSIWSLGFIAGGSPNEEAEYKTSTGTYKGKDLNYDPTTFGLSLAYRYFTTHLFFGGGLDMISASDSGNRTYSNTTLSGFPLSAMGGIYHSTDSGNLLLLEGGYRYAKLSQDSNSYRKLETDISSPFVGIHYFVGGFQLGMRYFTANTSTIGFYLTMGANNLESGYRLPAEVEAQKGRDYKELN